MDVQPQEIKAKTDLCSDATDREAVDRTGTSVAVSLREMRMRQRKNSKDSLVSGTGRNFALAPVPRT